MLKYKTVTTFIIPVPLNIPRGFEAFVFDLKKNIPTEPLTSY
jgi:hypothetical protein